MISPEYRSGNVMEIRTIVQSLPRRGARCVVQLVGVFEEGSLFDRIDVCDTGHEQVIVRKPVKPKTLGHSESLLRFHSSFELGNSWSFECVCHSVGESRGKTNFSGTSSFKN